VIKFHEGQEVEALRDGWADGTSKPYGRQWHKGTIVVSASDRSPDYIIEFLDGTRAVFDAGYIREQK